MQYLATLDNGTKLYLRRRQIIATNDQIRSAGFGEFAPTNMTADNADNALSMIFRKKEHTMSGIDYGMGMTNIDHETGIRYGVIHSNHLSPEAVSDLIQYGDDLDYIAWKEELVGQMKSGLSLFLSDYSVDCETVDCDSIIETLGIEYMNDGPSHYRYEADGYLLELMSDGDIFVLKSPHTTKRGFCSPCAPGACHLETDGDVPCYCLGPDWFDEHNPMPYAIESSNP